MGTDLQLEESKVAEAIFQIISFGKEPSQGKVIKLIGGSYSTVGPIFNQLKTKFNNFADLEGMSTFYKLKPIDLGKLMVENEQLKGKVKILEEHNVTLETNDATLRQQVATMTQEKQHFEQLYKSLQTERSQVLSQLKADQELQVNTLLAELCATHKAHAEHARNEGFSYDDKMIQKEITIRNLQAKVAELQLQLEASEKQALPQIRLVKSLRAENIELVNKVYQLEQQGRGVLHAN